MVRRALVVPKPRLSATTSKVSEPRTAHLFLSARPHVTTRRVEEGEEFSTTYGADFWLAGAPLELTPSVNLLVRELATCLHTTAQAVAASYAPDLRILTALFERSSKRR